MIYKDVRQPGIYELILNLLHGRVTKRRPAVSRKWPDAHCIISLYRKSFPRIDFPPVSVRALKLAVTRSCIFDYPQATHKAAFAVSISCIKYDLLKRVECDNSHRARLNKTARPY